MPQYAYKAVDLNGHKVVGRLDAINGVDLEMRLRRMDLDFIKAELLENRRLFARAGVSRREIIHFCFHLEQLTRAEVPLLEGLQDLRDSLEHARFREVIASLIEAIEGGQTLSQAMSGHDKVFNQVFVSLIRSGEATGRLPEVLRGLSESLKWEDEIAAHTKKLLLYPAFVATVVISATFFLMTYMVPQLKQFVKSMGQALPLQTQALFFVSDLIVAYWYVALVVPIAIAIALKILLRVNPLARLRFDRAKLELPFIGHILWRIILSRFANTFALLYSSGIPILESIRTTQGVVGNLVVRSGLERVEQLISEGQKVTAAFDSVGFFPPLIIRMLRIGETTGGLDVALANVSYFYNRDVRESVEKAQQLIEPILTVVLGCLLGWIMLSVLGPVYDVISRIRT